MKGSDKATCGDHGGHSKQSGDPCERVAGWGTEFEDGKCKQHRGTSPDGESHSGNQNATTHGLYAVPEYLREHFSEEQEDRYTAYFEALCSRYERLHGRTPDEFAKDRLSRVAIECVKERIADEYLSEQAHNGNILVETEVIGHDPDTKQPQRVTQENKILGELTALKRETRLTLKDMGLLHSPDDKQAEATRSLAEVLSDDGE